MPALLTTASPASRDGAAGLIASFRAHHTSDPVIVLATSRGVLDGLNLEGLVVDELITRIPINETFHPDDALVLALPHALQQVVAEFGRVAFVQPGCLITTPLERLDERLDSDPFIVLANTVLSDSTMTTPTLSQVATRRHLISSRAFAVSSQAQSQLAQFRTVMEECIIDPFMSRPLSLYPMILESILGDDNAVIMRGIIGGLRDYATIEAEHTGHAQLAVVEVDELWGIEREAANGQADPAQLSTRLGEVYLSRRIHDPRPLEPLANTVRAAAFAFPFDTNTETPFSYFCRDVRRATDPLGIRFERGEVDKFRSWLFESNVNGLTRAAHLYWYLRPDLQERFRHVNISPAKYRKWFAVNGKDEFGADLFDPSTPPRAIHSKREPEPFKAANRTEFLRNALAWRMNMLRSILPGGGQVGPGNRGLLRAARTLTHPKNATTKGQAVVPRIRVRPPKRILVDRVEPIFGSAPRQLNLIGLLRSNSGLGQAARASFGALQMLDRKFSYIDTTDHYQSRNTAELGLDRVPIGAFGDVNLIHANAAEFVGPLPFFNHRLGGRYNIAMWFWEGAQLPHPWLPAFDRLDELWVASEYLADVFGQYGKIPVHVVGTSAALPEPPNLTRKDLGLAEDEFVFLFVYDAQSVPHRKNPELTLEAFINAFGPKFEGVRFILKAHNLHKFPESERRLRQLAAENSAITIMEDYLPRTKLLALMALADVYVSLHAAEGFGLTLLEAMALGTPVICTAFSGNMDFTNKDNSWLVDYTLISLTEPGGPYPAGTSWARPSLESAVYLMREAANDRVGVSRKAGQAVKDAISAASLERYAARLDTQLRRVLD